MKKISIFITLVGAALSVGILYTIKNLGNILEDAYVFDEEDNEK
jgi:hypothetical protein